MRTRPSRFDGGRGLALCVRPESSLQPVITGFSVTHMGLHGDYTDPPRTYAGPQACCKAPLDLRIWPSVPSPAISGTKLVIHCQKRIVGPDAHNQWMKAVYNEDITPARSCRSPHWVQRSHRLGRRPRSSLISPGASTPRRSPPRTQRCRRMRPAPRRACAWRPDTAQPGRASPCRRRAGSGILPPMPASRLRSPTPARTRSRSIAAWITRAPTAQTIA